MGRPRFELKDIRVISAFASVDWSLVDGGGAVVMNGRHCVDFADEGRISRVVAFDLGVHDGGQK